VGTNITKATPQGANSSAMWIDPDRGNVQGLLLSDRLRFYVDHVQLIDPFTDANLGPASYDLTLGPECWYADHLKETGQAKRVLADGERLVLPPNSITFVSTKEKLNIPFYLAARFNLKLRLLHEGLLLGAGPQIDPGFSGRLSCPLHNISSEKISLTPGETFAVIEFHKTSPFAQEQGLPANASIAEIRRRGESGQLKGLGGYPCLTFPAHSLDREPVKRYVPAGRLVTSSVEGIEKKQQALRELVDRALLKFEDQINRVNLLAYLAVVTVAISLGAYFFAVVNWNKSVNDAAVRAEEHVNALESERGKTELRLEELEKTVEQLSSASSPEAVKKPTGHKRP
jgi:deoxycytidine triphosphate deaminase